MFRWIAVFGQGATVAITWGLWNGRAFPPRLPAIDLPSVDLAAPLLVSLLLVVAIPRVGLVAHTALLAYAMLIDQTRLQPEIVSLALLLWGTVPGRTAPLVARAHLIALWSYSGFNKLLSPGFVHGGARRVLPEPMVDLTNSFDEVTAYGIASFELAVGLASLVPRTRRFAPFGAFLLHASILFALVPGGRNEAVWPWNGVLAIAGFVFIAAWRESPLRSVRGAAWPARIVAAGLLLAPAGFYLGAMDAYLGHNLYSFNVPTTVVCTDQIRCVQSPETRATFVAFHVPMPPEHRLFRAHFRATCLPRDRMTIFDSRAWARWRGHDREVVTCSPR